MEWVSTIGVPAAVTVIILREVFSFLKEKKKNGNGVGAWRAQIDEMHEQVKKLHELHDVYDEDHVPVWHVRRSMERTLEKMIENSVMQTALLKEILRELSERSDR